jgi:MFS transporter, DHA1 family, inner membrane transport protein
VATALAVTGLFASFTYLEPFLTQVADVDSLPGVLLARGVAGVLGVVLAGAVVDRDPWRAMLGVVGLQAVALGVQWAFGSVAVVAVLAIAVCGLCHAGLATVIGARILALAPGDTAVASAVGSTAFNVGITVGALIGAALLPVTGVRGAVLAGAVLSGAAWVVVRAERSRP